MLTCANGAYCGLAPEPAAEAYGLKAPSFEITQMIKSLGYTFTGIAIFALSMLNGVSFANAFAWSNLPWILLSLDNIWNGTAKKMGQPAFAPLLLLAINVACFYCGITDTNVATAALGLSGWMTLNGALFALLPSKGLEAWGMSPEPKLNAMMKNMGYSLLSNAVMVYQVNSGTEIGAAFGQSFIVMIANLLDQLFVSKGFEALEADPIPAYVWLAIQAGVVACTLA